MKVLHKKLVVKFDDLHNKIFKVGGVELYRTDEWLHRDEQGKQSFEENCNYLETKPQVAVLRHSNSKYPYQPGDKLFLHYMAHVTATYANEADKDAFIDAYYVLFTFMPDGGYKMADGICFAEQLYTEDNVTPAGIIIDVLGHKPKLCQVRVTHAPEESEFKQGELVLTIDANQYPVRVDGKDYIMLREREIVGRVYA